MTIDIDFYLLSAPSLAKAEQMLCRLVEKIYREGCWLYIHCDSTAEARHLNELLWTYNDSGFLPHCLIAAKTKAPIQIGHSQPPQDKEILLNLTPTAPEFYQQFQRVLEIVPNDENLKQAGRDKYRIYQAAGCNLRTHKL